MIFIYVIFIGCNNRSEVTHAGYKYLEPTYNNIKLLPQNDTIHFALDEHTYTRIGAFNCFKHDTITYVSFYDRGSKSINVYNFYSGKLIVRKQLRQWIKSSQLDKAAVFFKNFDSVYVTTQSMFFLLDSAGIIKDKIEFSNATNEVGGISNLTPAVLKNEQLYIGIKPFLDEKSLKAQQEWQVLYVFDMKKKKRNFIYSLPDIYKRNLYGYSFLEYGYCLNSNGNFVFSFAADTNIYETNLADYHVAYLGRSKYQKGDIQPVTVADLDKDDSYKLYSLRDSYGAIFFDPYKKRYLRQAKQRMSDADFQSKTVRKKRSIIVFDENFKIIGEAEQDSSFSFESLLFTDGNIYARTNGKDEHALHFVKLEYKEADDINLKLAHKQTEAEKINEY